MKKMNVENNVVIDNFGWPILPALSERNDAFRFDFARYTINSVQSAGNEGDSTQPPNNDEKVRPDTVDLA